MTSVIPEFDIFGVIPPIRENNGTSPDRSPYLVDILTFCKRFGTSVERRVILRGLLNLRNTMRGAGLEVGFQWVDGSFVENVEQLRKTPPNDVDVVTFCGLGDLGAQKRLLADFPTLFQPRVKGQFMVDHYFVPTDTTIDHVYARKISYWYSMWSHQRETNRWKKFVCIDLDTADDHNAMTWLEAQ